MNWKEIIMACGKILLSVPLANLLMLSGCSGVQKEVEKEDNSVVCIKRADLRLVVAAMTRDVPAMEAALGVGADVNTLVEGLGPPIVVAALTDNYKAVHLLLDNRANINASDSQGYTALMNASLHNNKDMVQLLLSRGGDVKTPTYPTIHGKRTKLTALMIAKAQGFQDIVKLLTEAGAKE